MHVIELGNSIVRMIQTANALQKESSDCKDIDRMMELIQTNFKSAQDVLWFCIQERQRREVSDRKATEGINVYQDVHGDERVPAVHAEHR